MDVSDQNIELIQRLGDYSALSQRLNELSQRNKASSGTILQIIRDITTAVGKLLENRKDTQRQLEECKRNLNSTQQELEAAKKQYDDNIRLATETSRADIDKAKAERDAAIEAARNEKDAAIAAANAEKEETLRRLNEEQSQKNASYQAELEQKNRTLADLEASGQASSAEAEQLRMEKQRLSLAQQASQAALERDIRMKEEEFQRARAEANATYEQEKAEAARLAGEAQSAAVEARGTKCQEELDAYKRRIQEKLQESLAKQAEFLEELSRVVPLEELQTILDKLNGLNTTLGNEGGAGAGAGEGGIGGLLEGVGDLFGLGGQERAPASAQVQPQQIPEYQLRQQRKPAGLPRGSSTRGGRRTRKGIARKYTRKQRGGYQYGKTRTRTRSKSKSRTALKTRKYSQ